jgi:hypothetical protein
MDGAALHQHVAGAQGDDLIVVHRIRKALLEPRPVD